MHLEKKMFCFLNGCFIGVKEVIESKSGFLNLDLLLLFFVAFRESSVFFMVKIIARTFKLLKLEVSLHAENLTFMCVI